MRMSVDWLPVSRTVQRFTIAVYCGLLRSLKKPNPIISQHVLCVCLSVRYVV